MQDAASRLHAEWQALVATVHGMGQLFGDDVVSSLIGTSHQATQQMAGESYTPAAQGLHDFGEGLVVMAEVYDRTEQATTHAATHAATRVLHDGVTAAHVIGGCLFVCAAVVLALKINVIVQLTILAIEVVQAIATAPGTFGASLLEVPAFKKTTDMATNFVINEAMEKILGGPRQPGTRRHRAETVSRGVWSWLLCRVFPPQCVRITGSIAECGFWRSMRRRGGVWVGPATAVTSRRMLAARPELGAGASVFGRCGFARNRSPSKPVGAAGLAF